MLNKILKFLYNKYEKQFQDFFVESLIGYIPKDVNEPAIDFLKQGSERLEKWLLYQSYYLNRKAINDLKNAERYQGMLLNIKFLLIVSAQKRKQKQYVKEEKKESIDPMKGVETFLKGEKLQEEK